MKPNKPNQNLIRVSFALACSFFLLIVCQAQAWANGAGLVVKHGNGTVVTRYVSFSEPSISGLDLLRHSGLQVVAGGDGAVYKIDGEGNSNSWVIIDGKTYYWAYYHLKRSSWQYSNIGAASYQVKNGDVEGWAWGQGSLGQGNAPPVITFAQIAPATPASTSSSGGSASSASSGSQGSQTAPSSSQSTNPASSPQTTNQNSNSSGQEMSATQASDADQKDKHSSKKGEEKKSKKKGSFWQLVAFGVTVFFLGGLIIVYRRRNSKKPAPSITSEHLSPP